MADSTNSSSRAVFLSYASQDAEAARRLCEALRGAGVDVWFDAEGGLEHGDEWDAKIRRQIKECLLFVPLISAHTQAREEGYFRIEWEIAAERAMGIASGVAFLLPVLIDDTREPDALVPDRFRKVQWTRVPDGRVSPEALARFLKLWSHRIGATKAATESAPAAPAPGPTRPSAVNRRRFPAIAAAAALLLVGLAALYMRPHSAPPVDPGPAAKRDAAPPKAPAVAAERDPSAELGGLTKDPELIRALRAITKLNAIPDDFAFAEDIVKTVLARRPTDTDVALVYAHLCNEYVNRGFDLSDERVTLAFRYARRAYEAAPEEAPNMAEMAMASTLRGNDLDRAGKLFRAAIAKNPDVPWYYRMLFNRVLRRTDIEAAYALADAAARRFPKDVLTQYECALLFRNRSIADEQAALDRTLALAPVGNAIIRKASFAGWLNGDPAAMRAWLLKLPDDLRLTGRAAIAWVFYSLCGGETREAREIVEAYPERDFADFFYTGPKSYPLGLLYGLEGRADQARIQFELALRDLNAQLERNPTDPNARQDRAWVLLGLGRTEEAGADALVYLGSLSRPLRQTVFEYPAFGVITLLLLTHRKSEALDGLREICAQHDMNTLYFHGLQHDIRLKAFRGDPDIAAVLKGAVPTTGF